MGTMREVAGGTGCKVRVVGSVTCLRCQAGAPNRAPGRDIGPALLGIQSIQGLFELEVELVSMNMSFAFPSLHLLPRISSSACRR